MNKNDKIGHANLIEIKGGFFIEQNTTNFYYFASN
jgi:hypothetical protein